MLLRDSRKSQYLARTSPIFLRHNFLPNISEEAGDPGDVGSYGSGPFISRSHRLQTCNENVTNCNKKTELYITRSFRVIR